MSKNKCVFFLRSNSCVPDMCIRAECFQVIPWTFASNCSLAYYLKDTTEFKFKMIIVALAMIYVYCFRSYISSLEFSFIEYLTKRTTPKKNLKDRENALFSIQVTNNKLFYIVWNDESCKFFFGLTFLIAVSNP